jgi:hypothetical protein
MTSESQLRAIERRLSAPNPNKERIALEVGVSPDTVARIAKQGRRYRQTASKHRRCPGCGGLQTAPCLVCASRTELAAA